MLSLLLLGIAGLTKTPVVPLAVQRNIAAQVEPQLAYVPTTQPTGYQYVNWFSARTRPHGLTIAFRWRHARYPGVQFSVSAGCAEAGATMKRFRFGRVTVRWSTTYVDAQAWSCVTRGRRRIMFYVSAPGYGLRGSPSPRELALMIGASQHLLR